MKKNVGDDNTLKVINEVEKLISKTRYDKESTGDWQKTFPEEIEKLREISGFYISEHDSKDLKTEFLDKWK